VRMHGGDATAGDRKGRAAEFDAADYQADARFPYFSGRDVVKGEAHRFIVKPAMPA
jgi:hypothetical protein